MIKAILQVIIALFLAQSCLPAGVEQDEDNLLTTYTGETSTQIPNGPRLPHYYEITADNQPDYHPENHGYVRFEDEPPDPFIQSLFLETTNANNPFAGLNKPGRISNIDNINFETDQNDGLTRNQFESEPSQSKVLGDPLQEVLNREETKDNDSHIDNDEKFDDDEYIDDLKETDEGKALNLKEESDSEKSKGHIAFKDDSKIENGQESVRKKTRRRRRKPRTKSLSPGTALLTNKGPVPNYGYLSYQSSGHSSYPDPIEPISEFPIPHPDLYPGYPTPYSVSPYPTADYLGFSSYQSGYPGYTPYPSTQGSESQIKPAIQAETKHPTNKSPGTNSSGQKSHGRTETYIRPGQVYAGGYPGYPAQPSHPEYGGNSDVTGQYRPYPGYSEYYRLRPPKSLTQRALSAVAEALTSIALFDDKKCVPRLLCEVASGSTASSPTLQKATAGLRPLISVLQSYNGLSSSPLFLFGRAAVLGMTAKGNPTSCRYAYPQCPNNAAGLIDYLNNHNGGFFRFFGAPEKGNQQQNLEQFYSHLSGQNGYQKPQQNYGYPYNYSYSPRPQNYGYYREQNSFRNAKEIDSEVAGSIIEERIQNKPIPDADEDVENDINEPGLKWTFPDQVSNKNIEENPRRQRRERDKKPRAPRILVKGERGGGALIFPDEKGLIDESYVDREIDYIRKQKGIFFPNKNHFNFQTSYQTSTPVNLGEYVFDHKHNFYVKRPKAVANDDNTKTVYIVRGKGDPNHPEIVKLRPGQSL